MYMGLCIYDVFYFISRCFKCGCCLGKCVSWYIHWIAPFQLLCILTWIAHVNPHPLINMLKPYRILFLLLCFAATKLIQCARNCSQSVLIFTKHQLLADRFNLYILLNVWRTFYFCSSLWGSNSNSIYSCAYKVRKRNTKIGEKRGNTCRNNLNEGTHFFV